MGSTLTTHVKNHPHPLTTPAAAESGGGGPMGTRGHAQIHLHIFVKESMEMYGYDMAMELDQDLKGEAKRAFRSCFRGFCIFLEIWIFYFLSLDDYLTL